MSYVLDASVAFEYLLRTPLGLRIADMIEGTSLFAPELLDVEVLSILRRAVFRGLITEARASEAVSDLVLWPLERITHRELAQSAWQFRNNVSAYDSFYVAAAFKLDVGLLTADGPLTRAPLPGVTIVNVRVSGKS